MRVSVRSRSLLVAAALVLALPVPPVFADEIDEAIDDPVPPKFKFLGEAGFTYQGEADLDGGGNVTVYRDDVGVAGRTNLTEHVRWANTLFVGIGIYDFDGGGFSSPNPWDTVLSMRFATKFTYDLTPQWGISAGGLFMISPETGANWGDSITGGVMVGVEYRHSETLSASLGIAAISQLEDDWTAAPSVGIFWRPTESWTVRVGGVPASGGAAAAAEVAYRINEPFEVALGALYNERRFRLDDSGFGSDGIGEDNSLPVRVRFTWNITPQIALNLLGGVVFAGDVRLEDDDGDRIASTDYDPAPYAGFRIVGRF